MTNFSAVLTERLGRQVSLRDLSFLDFAGIWYLHQCPMTIPCSTCDQTGMVGWKMTRAHFCGIMTWIPMPILCSCCGGAGEHIGYCSN